MLWGGGGGVGWGGGVGCDNVHGGCVQVDDTWMSLGAVK